MAYKRARARFDVFRQVLAAEAEAARRLPELAGLRTAVVVAAGPFGLVKELHEGPTLQRLVAAGELRPAQRAALEEVLRRGARLHAEHGFLADLSPKNLAWGEGGWTLLDTGQPLVRADRPAALLAEPTWPAYAAAVADRLVGADSRPSAFAGRAGREELDEDAVRRRVFLREWWDWFPLDPAPERDRFLVDLDPAAPAPEYLFEAAADAGAGRVAADADPALAAAPVVRAAAAAAWRRRHPERPLVLPAGAELPDDALGLAPGVAPLGLGRALRLAAGLEDAPAPRPRGAARAVPGADAAWDLPDPTGGRRTLRWRPGPGPAVRLVSADDGGAPGTLGVGAEPSAAALWSAADLAIGALGLEGVVAPPGPAGRRVAALHPGVTGA